MDPKSIKWKLTGEARKGAADDRATLGEEEYLADRDRLRLHLCDYFRSGKCASKGISISPVGKNSDGGKVLKVRWGRPGCGKSGGVRMAIVAYCDEMLVILCRVFLRRDEPSDAEFEDAGELAARDRD